MAKGIISLEDAFNKQKWILRNKINKNFDKCIKDKDGDKNPTLEIFCSCLDEIWFNPKDKGMKWDKNTYKDRKGKLITKIV